MIRGLALAAVFAAVVAGLYLAAMNAARDTLLLAKSGPALAPREPEIVLHDVEVREVRDDGRRYRLHSENASYSVVSKRISAERVTLTVPGGRDRIVVRAPRALWDMDRGRMELDQGAEAVNGAGWAATVPEARIDLRAQVLTAREASLSIPGVRVAGDNLVWRWEDGSMELDAPKSRVLPRTLGAARGGADRE